jgi:hypothetical protein
MRKGVASAVKFSGTLNQGQPTVGYRVRNLREFSRNLRDSVNLTALRNLIQLSTKPKLHLHHRHLGQGKQAAFYESKI